MSERITALWVYWKHGAEGDELEWSVRSVLKNLHGVRNLVVVGDDPGPWFRELGGTVVRCPRVTVHIMRQRYGIAARVRWIKWCDSVHKMLVAATQPESVVSSRFLWLYDDTFFMRATDVSEIGPYYTTVIDAAEDPEPRSWREVRRRTFAQLAARGFPTYDFSTHFPAIFEKTKLLAMIATLDALRCPTVIESAYLNMWHGSKAKKFPPGLFRYTKSGAVTNWRSAKVLNLGNGAWKKSREAVVAELTRTT